MRQMMTLLAAAVMAASFAAAAYAAGSVTGKVTKVEGDKVTVAVEGAVPAWAKKGANVTAGGGSPKVLAVQGNEITLKFSKAKAEKIKPDSAMKLTESDGDELQGC